MVVVAATVSLLTFRILKHKDIGICGWPVISRPWEIVLLSFKGVLCLKCNWFQGIMESFFFSHKQAENGLQSRSSENGKMDDRHG